MNIKTIAVAVILALCSFRQAKATNPKEPALLAFPPPALLQSVDPLASPPPRLPRPLRFTSAATTTIENKILVAGWNKIDAARSEAEMEVIVLLREPDVSDLAVGAADPDALRLDHIAAVEHAFVEAVASLPFVPSRGLSHFPIVFGRLKLTALAELAANPFVLSVEEVRPYHAARVEGGNLIKAHQLRNQLGGDGHGMAVAVLDTGIDFFHPEFSGRIAAQGDYTNTTGNGNDDEGHGTACAGIIAGSGGGMAPQAKLWALKVLDSSGNGNSASTLTALNDAFAQRNNFGGLRVISMSLGGGGPINADCDGVSPYAAVISQLTAAGIAVVVASGNEGYGAGVDHPACLSKVIAVGAVYDANVGPRGPFPQAGNCFDATTAADQITCYSNSGEPLDVLGPADCASTTKRGGGIEACFNGTSAATPYAAGVVAQILSLHPTATPTQLRLGLMATGRPRTDVNGITRSRIDAVAAFQSLSGGGGGTGPCVQDSTTACLLNNRFRAVVRFRGSFDNSPADSSAFRKPVTGFASPSFETAFFYFNSENNIEILLKMLDQGNTNGQGQPTIAVLFGSATPLRTEVTITDTTNGAVRTYTSQFNSGAGQTDFTAFVK